jgi:DNA-binding response OmpR family regulator/HD-like signal output (HDOD) protein
MGDRILVVDDDLATRSALDRSLRRLGYDVLVAGDGEEGLQLAMQHAPRVVITDIRMPRMDGHTLLRRLAGQGSDGVVIVMSAEGDMQDVIDVLRHGAVDYLVKPWSPSDLIAAVGRAVEMHTRRAEGRLSRPSAAAAPPLLEVIRSAAPPQAEQTTEAAATPPVDGDVSGILELLRRGLVTIPAASPIVAEIRRKIQSATARAEDIAALIERDPCLANSVLKISNSAAYASSTRHRDLATAVRRIGFRAIQNAVETISANECYRVRDERLATLQAHIWRYSVALALSMRALAEIAPTGGRIEPDRAYASGLLANVGASFLVWQASERAPQGTDWSRRLPQLLAAVRVQHEEVGRLVLGRRALDQEIALVAGAHHASAPPAPPSPYWSLSILASQLARRIVVDGDPTADAEPDANVIDRCSSDLRIGTIAIQRMRDSVQSELESVLETTSSMASS